MDNYFTEKELTCPCCGRNEFKQTTLDKFNKLREIVGLPLKMSSGYRCEKYNELKGFTQTHATGQAGDLQVTHKLAFAVMKHAPEVGFTGVGISQKGNAGGRFIHLDDLMEANRRPRPHVWSY